MANTVLLLKAGSSLGKPAYFVLGKACVPADGGGSCDGKKKWFRGNVKIISDIINNR
jgi:hypothetical protein